MGTTRDTYDGLEDEFGDVIGKARRGQQLSVQDLSRAADVAAQRIEAMEAYTVRPETGEVERLARALGLHEAKLRTSAVAGFFPRTPHPPTARSAGLEVCMLVLGTDFLMNGYLAICRQTRKAVVIDPGFQAPRILQAAAEHNAHIDCVWLTHGHYDHLEALSEITAATGAGAAIHAADLELAGTMASHIGARLVAGGQVRVGAQSFDVRATPGHTEGGVSLIHAEGTAFVGDALFAGSLGGTRQRKAYEAQIAAVSKQLLSLPPETTLYPGHGPATTVSEERDNNPFFV